MIPPLHGLLLVGGKSRRMGRNKAALAIDGAETLQDRGLRLLDEVTGRTFLSIAADDKETHPIETIRDVESDLGPLGGVHSAFVAHPDAAWLVLACDLPNLTLGILQQLVRKRDPSVDATCFRSELDSQPEPLCAIYEPSAATAIATAVETRQLCARRCLAGMSLHSLPAPRHGALQNCNRPEDVEELRQLLKTGLVPKPVTVEYFAKLRDEAGCESEPVITECATAAGLWETQRMRHSLSLDLDTVRLAINDEFAPWTSPLHPNDRVAFLPPFAGG